MKRRTSTCLLVLLAGLAQPVLCQPLDFSVDPASPESWSPGDLMEGRGEQLRVAATDLGLITTDDVTGFSYGNAEIEVLADYNFVRIAYSVSRGSTGINGLISRQAVLNGAAGDKFGVTIVNYRGRILVLRRPYLISDAPVHNLTPNPGESELDGMSLFLQSANYPVYLSLSPASGYDPAAVYIIRSKGSPPEVFARPVDLGLVNGDQIDALAVGTTPVSLPPPQSLGPEVVIWISLKAGSPTRSIAEVRGGDGVIQVYPMGPQLAIDAPALDLGPNDELDALTGLDPGEVPEEDDISGQPGRDPVDVDVLYSGFSNSLITGTAVMNRASSGPVAEITLHTDHPAFGGDITSASQILGADPSGINFVDVRDIEVSSPLNYYGILADVFVTVKVFSTGFSVDGETPVDVPGGSTVTLRYTLNGDFELNYSGEYQIVSGDATYYASDVQSTPHAPPSVAGTGESVLFPGFDIQNLGSPGIPDAFLVSSESLWGGTEGPDAVLQVEDADSQAFTLFQGGSGSIGNQLTGLWAVQSTDNTQTDVTVHFYRADHEPETFTFEDLNPFTSPQNPLALTAVIGFSIDPETGDVTFPFVQPLNSEGIEPVEVASMVATPDGAAIAVNVQRDFRWDPFIFGQPGRQQAFLFKVGTNGTGNWMDNPEMLHALETDNPREVIATIPEIAMDDSTGELGVILNTRTFFRPENAITFTFGTPNDGATQPVYHSENANVEGTFFALDFRDFSFTNSQLTSITGNNPILFSQALTFDSVDGAAGTWTIGGSATSNDSFFQPGNLQVPFNASINSKPFQSFTLSLAGGYALPTTDLDRDGWPAPAEAYFGTSDRDPVSAPTFSLKWTDDEGWSLSAYRARYSGYDAVNTFSNDFGSWTKAPIEPTGEGDEFGWEVLLKHPGVFVDNVSEAAVFHDMSFFILNF